MHRPPTPSTDTWPATTLVLSGHSTTSSAIEQDLQVIKRHCPELHARDANSDNAGGKRNLQKGLYFSSLSVWQIQHARRSRHRQQHEQQK